MALYHKDIKLPKGFNSAIGTICLTYSNHAHQTARSDKYGSIVLPRSINTNKALCFEVELIEGKVTKLVYRVAYDSTLDLILVCRPKGNGFNVTTVWLNLKSDKHATLDLTRYEAA
jgi:hypothetical protein